MVGGQQDDLDAEGTQATTRHVSRIHLRKTARLLAASLEAGALLAGAGTRQRQEIHRAGVDLGLAFQGADDLLDVTGDAVVLGKNPGKDAAQGKATWIRTEGWERASLRTGRHGQAGMKRLAAVLPAGPAADRLLGLAGFMWRRDR